MRWGALFLCWSAIATPTLAQEDEDIARTHFEAGNAYYARGDFDEAIREFEHAYALSERPALLHNIYLAYRDLQDDSNAARYLRQYLEEGDDIENRPLLEERLRLLDAELLEQPEPEPEAESGHGAAWGVLVSGAAVLIGGAIAGGLALRSRNTLDDEWCEGSVCRPGFEAERDTGERSAMAANVLLSVGALAVIASIPLFFIGGDDSDEPQAGLQCGPGACMGSIRGSF